MTDILLLLTDVLYHLIIVRLIGLYGFLCHSRSQTLRSIWYYKYYLQSFYHKTNHFIVHNTVCRLASERAPGWV